MADPGDAGAVLTRIERDLASHLHVGLGSVTPEAVKDLAQALRNVGLDGPAGEADRLGSLVGRQGSAVDQLAAFARLQQMVQLVRTRLLTVGDLPDGDWVEPPGVSGLLVDKGALEARAEGSLLDAPWTGDPLSKFGYALRVQRRMPAGTLPALEGEGIAVWANLGLGDLLLARAAASPARAAELAGQALRMQNVVIRRHGAQILGHLVGANAPLADTDPRMQSLAQALGDPRPLVMHEALAAWRRGKGWPPEDPRQPYLGIADGRTYGPIAQRLAYFRTADEIDRIRNASWWLDWRLLDDPDDLQEALTGPQGAVIARLARTATEAADQEDRQRAIEVLRVVEDPLAIPLVRRALSDRAAAVRHSALLCLGSMGDESILPLCRERLAEPGEPSRVAMKALCLLGDFRGLHLIWSAYEDGQRMPPDVAETWFRLFGEPGAAALVVRLAMAPKLMAKITTQVILRESNGERAAGVVLRILDEVKGARSQHSLLNPFRLKGSELTPVARTLGWSATPLPLLLARIRDPTVPLERRREAVGHVRYIMGDKAEERLRPVMETLPPEIRADLARAPPKARKKAGGGDANAP